MDLQPNDRLVWSCTNPRHQLNVSQRTHGFTPDSWSFSLWELGLLSTAGSCGTHVGVLRVSANELHIFSSGTRHRVVAVFERVGQPSDAT